MTAGAIYIAMNGNEAEQEVRSLCTWLQEDDYIRRNAQVTFQASPPSQGSMGPDFETIELLVSSGFELANLALAYLSWRASRIERPPVTIRRGDIEVTLSESDPETIRKVFDALDSGGE
ncbi:effector-associated constant component EACC1 [Nonomuraea sp. H19]|uniref:effector-associated constant component EACC1 n=1 Tax=Nonomuraea sp. H19 TaxID=3452206 RepID=UPI003F8C537F